MERWPGRILPGASGAQTRARLALAEGGLAALRPCHPERSEGSPFARPKTLPVANWFIPPDIVLRSVRQDRHSDFVTFLLSILDPVVVEDLVRDYQLGVTSLMKASGQLPKDWELTQCLFGEHLLRQYPGKVVALVESEKTAVICAGLMPRFLWLATGGKSCVNERLLVLKGRKVVAFPDIDGYDEWVRKLADYPELGVTVSPVLQRNATREDREAHIDIADWLLRERCHLEPVEGSRHCRAFLEIQKYISPEVVGEVEALIEELRLEVWRVEGGGG